MIKGCAVVVYFDSVEFCGMFVEVCEEGTLKAHVAGSFARPEVSSQCAVVWSGDAEEMSGSS